MLIQTAGFFLLQILYAETVKQHQTKQGKLSSLQIKDNQKVRQKQSCDGIVAPGFRAHINLNLNFVGAYKRALDFKDLSQDCRKLFWHMKMTQAQTVSPHHNFSSRFVVF